MAVSTKIVKIFNPNLIRKGLYTSGYKNCTIQLLHWYESDKKTKDGADSPEEWKGGIVYPPDT